MIFFLFSLQYNIRKEIRDLSDEEWLEFKGSVEKLRENGTIDKIAKFHHELEKYAHNTERFLPWHRMLLLFFEKELQKVSNNPKITVPYWNWALDAEDPSESFIFKEKYWDSNKCFLVNYPTEHCVLRNKEKMDPFYSRSQLKTLLNKRISYSKFRELLETVPHALVHMNVGGSRGGDMATLYSCTDPIFWHHHSFIDYLWSLKKDLKNTYSENPEEILIPFQRPISSVLNLDDCNIKYKKYKSTRIEKENKPPGKLSESFIQHHKYDPKKIKEYEELLGNIENNNKLVQLIKKILCIA